MDMRSKVVVITGGTAGIGKAAAVALAQQGATLVIVGRDPAKGAAVVEELDAAAPDAPARFVRADLSELAQVRTLAEGLTSSLDRIDVLVNNAGIAARRPRTSVDGFDEMLAANYLGPFLLTHLLLDTLRSSAPARVVVVGSEAHRTSGRFDPERFEQLGDYSGLGAQLAYGRTKLLDILFAEELARRLAGTGLTVNSLCPGAVATELVREVGGPAGGLGRLLAATPLIRTPEQGARMTVHLASSPDVASVTGRFYSSTPGLGLLPTVSARRDPAVAARVYERTCQLVGIPPL
jgi:NAD(P)-dependent dehydrogenase (short-subunit alcohol dehydrogenase family)